MTIQEAILELEKYNKWRLGAEIPQPNPKKITQAIDIAIKTMKNE